MAPKLRRCCFYGPTKKGQVVTKCIDSNEVCAPTLKRGQATLPLISTTGPVANCGGCKKVPIAGFEGFELISAEDDETN